MTGRTDGRWRRSRLLGGVLLGLAVLTGCGTPGGSPGPVPASTAGATSGAGAPAGREPVIVDTDLSFDDLLALAFLARDPAVDLRAVTVVGTGLAHCAQGLQVATSLLNTLDRMDLPLACGPTEPLAGGHPFPDAWRTTADQAYGLALEQRPVTMSDEDAPDMLASVAAAEPAPVTILSLGPMTNLALAFAAHPDLQARVGRIVAMAGAVDVTGNVEQGAGWGPAEWNVYADPAAAAQVLEAGVPVTLVPLDATNDVPVTQALIDTLEADHRAAPADVAYELLAKRGVWEGDYMWDALAAVVMVEPSVASYETVRLAVITEEGADSGRTIRADRGRDVIVATSADAAAFTERFLEGLRLGDPRPHPFVIAGSVAVAFEGDACVETRSGSAAPGTWRIDAQNAAAFPVVVVLVKFHEGSGWDDLVAYVATEPDPSVQPPFLDVPGLVVVEPGSAARGFAAVEPGRHGVVCIHEGDGSPGVVLGPGEFEVAP